MKQFSDLKNEPIMNMLTPEEYEEARERMVKTQLVAPGVQRYSIIERMGELEREIFTPEEFKLIAYSAKEIPLSGSRFMLNPMNLGLILDRVDFDSVSKVIVLGDGTGYVTALLADIVDSVVSVDNIDNFKSIVEKNLRDLNVENVEIIQGDITKGCPAKGPYDLIFINGAVQQIPDNLFAQLSDNGKILTALKKPFISHAIFQHKVGDTIQTERLFECSISLLPEFSKKSKFVF